MCFLLLLEHLFVRFTGWRVYWVELQVWGKAVALCHTLPKARVGAFEQKTGLGERGR